MGKQIKKKPVKKREVKIKENDLTQNKEFLEALDKMIKSEAIKKENK